MAHGVTKFGEMLMKKQLIRQLLAEYIATFILVLFGCGSIATYLLVQQKAAVDPLAVAIGWGLSLMVAVNLAIGISGAHLNPAVTIGHALIDNIDWQSAGYYIAAQFFGAFTAGTFLFLAYVHDIREAKVENTMRTFVSDPRSNVNIFCALFDQALGTFILMFVILTITDSRSNFRLPKYLVPFYAGLTITMIIIGLGGNCGAPLNPARDFAPRLVLLFTGRNHFDNFYWIFGPILGTISGACLAAILFIYSLGNHRLMGHGEHMPMIGPVESHDEMIHEHFSERSERSEHSEGRKKHRKPRSHHEKPLDKHDKSDRGSQSTDEKEPKDPWSDLPPLVPIDEVTGEPMPHLKEVFETQQSDADKSADVPKETEEEAIAEEGTINAMAAIEQKLKDDELLTDGKMDLPDSVTYESHEPLHIREEISPFRPVPEPVLPEVRPEPLLTDVRVERPRKLKKKRLSTKSHKLDKPKDEGMVDWPREEPPRVRLEDIPKPDIRHSTVKVDDEPEVEWRPAPTDEPPKVNFDLEPKPNSVKESTDERFEVKTEEPPRVKLEDMPKPKSDVRPEEELKAEPFTVEVQKEEPPKKDTSKEDPTMNFLSDA